MAKEQKKAPDANAGAGSGSAKEKGKPKVKKKKKSTFDQIKSVGLWVITAIFVVSIFGGLGAFGWTYFTNPGAKLATASTDKRPDVILKIDETPVKREEFRFETNQILQQIGQNIRGDQRIFVENLVIDRMTEQKLLLDYAKQNNIKMERAELDSQLKDYRNMILGDPGRLDEDSVFGGLKFRLAEKDREKQFRKRIYLMGFNYKEFRQYYGNNSLARKAQTKLSESLLSGSEAEARKKAEEVLAKVKANEKTFEELVEEYSEDLSTKAQGGSRGWIKRGDLPPGQEEYEKLAFSLEPELVADQPIKTQAGFHIMKVVSRKEASGPAFEAEKDGIRKRLEEERGKDGPAATDQDVKNEYEQALTSHILIKTKSENAMIRDWLDEEKPKHKIEVIDPVLKAYRFSNKLDVAPENRASTEVDYERAEGLYSEAIDATPDDPYVYKRLAQLYLDQYDKAVEKERSRLDEEKKAKEEEAAKKEQEAAAAVGEAGEAGDDAVAQDEAPEEASDGEGEDIVDPFNPSGEAEPADAEQEKPEELLLKDSVFLQKALAQALLAKKKSEDVLPDASIYIMLGEIYRKQGENEQSLEAYTDASELVGPDMLELRQLEMAFEELGQPEKAREMKELREGYQESAPQ